MLKRLTQLKNKKGFTLIEMIVVLVIIAILIVATVPTMMGFINDARDRATAAEARSVYMAIQGTIAHYGTASSVWGGPAPKSNLPGTTIDDDPIFLRFMEGDIETLARPFSFAVTDSGRVHIGFRGTNGRVVYIPEDGNLAGEPPNP